MKHTTGSAGTLEVFQDPSYPRGRLTLLRFRKQRVSHRPHALADMIEVRHSRPIQLRTCEMAHTTKDFVDIIRIRSYVDGTAVFTRKIDGREEQTD